MESLEDKYFILDSQEIVLEDFETQGYVLDIGGGGEGIIGRKHYLTSHLLSRDSLSSS